VAGFTEESEWAAVDDVPGWYGVDRLARLLSECELSVDEWSCIVEIALTRRVDASRRDGIFIVSERIRIGQLQLSPNLGSATIEERTLHGTDLQYGRGTTSSDLFPSTVRNRRRGESLIVTIRVQDEVDVDYESTSSSSGETRSGVDWVSRR